MGIIVGSMPPSVWMFPTPPTGLGKTGAQAGALAGGSASAAPTASRPPRAPRQYVAPTVIYRSHIFLTHGQVDAIVNNSRVHVLNLAIDSEQKVYVNNIRVIPKFVTVEFQENGHWHKFYMHHGRVGAVNITNCKFMAFHGSVHVFLNGAEVKSSVARFEVVTI